MRRSTEASGDMRSHMPNVATPLQQQAAQVSAALCVPTTYFTPQTSSVPGPHSNIEEGTVQTACAHDAPFLQVPLPSRGDANSNAGKGESDLTRRKPTGINTMSGILGMRLFDLDAGIGRRLLRAQWRSAETSRAVHNCFANRHARDDLYDVENGSLAAAAGPAHSPHEWRVLPAPHAAELSTEVAHDPCFQTSEASQHNVRCSAYLAVRAE